MIPYQGDSPNRIASSVSGSLILRRSVLGLANTKQILFPRCRAQRGSIVLGLHKEQTVIASLMKKSVGGEIRSVSPMTQIFVRLAFVVYMMEMLVVLGFTFTPKIEDLFTEVVIKAVLVTLLTSSVVYLWIVRPLQGQLSQLLGDFKASPCMSLSPANANSNLLSTGSQGSCVPESDAEAELNATIEEILVKWKIPV